MKRPFMCLYINDILGHENVQALDDLGFAYYMRMLMRAWKSQEAYKLPNTELALQIAAGCKDIDEWAKRRDLILLNWPESKDGKWRVNGRLKEEYQKMLAKHKARQAAGKKGGAAKAKASNAKAKPKQNEQTQTQTQTHKEQLPLASSPVATQPSVIKFPLNDGSEYGITAKYLAELQALYPAVDVPQQLRNMLGWLKAKPDRRKTGRGINAFINRWLSKAQDESPISRNGNGGHSKAQQRTAGNITSIAAGLGLMPSGGGRALPDGDHGADGADVGGIDGPVLTVPD